VTARLAFEESPETNGGRMLYEMLLAVHGHIRSDLVRVERLTEAVVGELSTDELEHELEELRRDTMLWQCKPASSAFQDPRFEHDRVISHAPALLGVGGAWDGAWCFNSRRCESSAERSRSTRLPSACGRS
jgi:hypothetical protein